MNHCHVFLRKRSIPGRVTRPFQSLLRSNVGRDGLCGVVLRTKIGIAMLLKAQASNGSHRSKVPPRQDQTIIMLLSWNK